MKLNVSHQTHYTYAQQVKRSTQYLGACQGSCRLC